MIRSPLLVYLGLLLIVVSGCASEQHSAAQITASPEPTQQVSHIMAIDEQDLAEMNTPTVEPGPTLTPAPASIATPTKEQVLAAREQALEGMTDEQTDWLYTVIVGANDWWERQYLWENIFEYLEDPNDPAWNYFDQTGEINVQWSYTGDEYDAGAISEIMETEGLSWTGFCEKYGTDETLSKLIVNNEYDADDFIGIIADIQSSVQNVDLKNDFQTVIDKTALARDTHDMHAANDLYKTLHDLDYFLLRYGPEDPGAEVKDASLVSKYFGMLSFFD